MPPSQLNPPPPTQQSVTVQVIDGWTGRAVVGARTMAGGTEAISDNAGRIQVVKGAGCVEVAVYATGYLDRRACTTGEITLWPSGDERETVATRTAAFERDALLSAYWAYPTQISFSPTLRNQPDVVTVWTEAAEHLSALTFGRIHLDFVSQDPLEGLVIGVADPVEACVGTPWPLATGGFCVVPTPTYFLDEIRVRPEVLTDPAVALRALMWSVRALRPHELPGLMNATAPGPAVSPFEAKSLHMIGLRRHVDLRWPDFETPR